MADFVGYRPNESIARRIARQLRANLGEAWQGAQYERPVKDEPGVMAEYGSTPVDPNQMPAYERVNSVGLKDLAEVGFEFGLSPALSLATYAPEAEGAKLPKGGKAAKASTKSQALKRVLKGETTSRSAGKSESFDPAGFVAAPKEVNVDRKFKSGEKEGLLRGTEAFGGIRSENLGPMRAQYMQKMEQGAPGRYWYDDTSADIFRLTGGDPERADILANMLATTSSRTPVGSNAMYGFKGWNQALVGNPVRTGGFPQAMGEDIEHMIANPEARATGLKRSPFSAGLSVAWRGPEFVKRATHDIHDVRAWGIKDPLTGEDWKKGVGDAGHRFLDEQADVVTQRANDRALAGYTDWNPYRSQAAAWISQKAAKEGVPIEEAARHYGDFIDDYSGQVTREWTPGTNTGHLPELSAQGANPRDRELYARYMEQALRGEGGVDRLASGAGALSDKTLRNVGVYEGDVNPGFISRIPVGKGTGTHEIEPSSAAVMDSVAAMHGLVGSQKQSAWNATLGPSSIKSAGAFNLKRDTPFTLEELRSLGPRVAQAGGDIPMVTPKGARVLEFADEGDPARMERVKQLRTIAPEYGATVEPMHRSSNIFPVDENFNAPEKYSTGPYIEKIEAGGPKMVEGFERTMQTLGPELLARTQKIAAAKGWTQAPFYEPLMRALSLGPGKALAELKRLRAEGVVPAAVMVDLGIDEGGE